MPSQDESEKVVVLHPIPDALEPCPAKIDGPFLASDATFLRCGGAKNHGGEHYYLVQWSGDAR